LSTGTRAVSTPQSQPASAADVAASLDDPSPSPSETEECLGEESRPSRGYFGRFGSVVLKTGCQRPTRVDLYEKVRSALERDSRVSLIEEALARPEWMAAFVMYPDDDGSQEDLLTETDHFHAVRLRDPLVFTVRVPKRNQPRFKDSDDIPTDIYYTAWDGVSLIVLWDRPLALREPPRSGGHVVVDILKDVSQAAGFDLYVQACNPACTNIFAHQVLRIEQYKESEHPTAHVVEGSKRPVVDVHVGALSNGSDVAMMIYRGFGFRMMQFARLKNSSRRLRAVEQLVRKRLAKLLQLQYSRNSRRTLHLRERVSALWTHRNDRSTERRLAAALWLGLARIEVTGQVSGVAS
jgi:hypothetical protein